MKSRNLHYEELSQHSAKHLLAVTSDLQNSENKKEKSEVVLPILPPIRIIESKNYKLKIQDSSGKYYYFNEDGTYDGWSMDVNWNEN